MFCFLLFIVLSKLLNINIIIYYVGLENKIRQEGGGAIPHPPRNVHDSSLRSKGILRIYKHFFVYDFIYY